MAEKSLVDLIAHEKDIRDRIKQHRKDAEAQSRVLDAALQATRHQIGCAKAGFDNDRIENALKVLKVEGSYENGGDERATVIRDAVDWLATGECACYYNLDQADFGTKQYAHWHGQRSDHEWGGPKHGSIIFRIGLQDRKRELTKDERSDAIYFLLNIEGWESARANAVAA